jgi:hypothetical protein
VGACFAAGAAAGAAAVAVAECGARPAVSWGAAYDIVAMPATAAVTAAPARYFGVRFMRRLLVEHGPSRARTV